MVEKTNGYEILCDQPELEISPSARQKLEDEGILSKVVSYRRFSPRVQEVVKSAGERALELQRESVHNYLVSYKKKHG